MGNVLSRAQTDEEAETMGIAELFTVKTAPQYALLPRWLRRWLIKLRLATHPRVPARCRQRGVESIDSMGEMRCILSAMGGWEEGRQESSAVVVRGRRRQPRTATLDSLRGPWAGVYARGAYRCEAAKQEGE